MTTRNLAGAATWMVTPFKEIGKVGGEIILEWGDSGVPFHTHQV